MAHSYQSVNNFRESGKPGLHKTWRLWIKFFLTILIVWGLPLARKTFFLSLNLIYGGNDGSFLKYVIVIPLNKKSFQKIFVVCHCIEHIHSRTQNGF